MTNHRYRPSAKYESAGRKLLARRTTRDAILGDENGFVDVPNELGYHWARFAASADANSNATFGPSFRVMANPGAGYSPTPGRRVKLKLTDEGWEVEKGSFQDMVQAGIDPRALNPNDPYRAFRYLDEITDTSSRGIGSGLKVQVQGWKYSTANNQFKIDIGTNAATHVDLTSSVPSAGNHRYAVLVFNVTEDIAGNDPWQVYDTTEVADTTAFTPALAEANIQTAYDLFPTDELIVPVKAYYLIAGQTTIKGPRYDVDLRTAWNIPGAVDGQVTIPKLSPFALKITTTAPTVDDDVSLGYVVGSHWIDTATDKEYVLTDSTNGAAVWIETTSGGISLPVVDTTAIVKGSADATELLRFEVDGFTTATTRVMTFPDYDGTVATLAGTENLSNKTITASTGTFTDLVTDTFEITGDTFTIQNRTIASSTDPGTVGEVCMDANYIYRCTAASTWRRVALDATPW